MLLMCVRVEINHFGNRLHNDGQIHKEGVFLDIYQVVVCSLSHMLDTVGAAPVPLNLGEPCNPWFYCVAIVNIIKCGVRVYRLIYWICTQADQPHLPFEYIEKLRKFIQI